MPVLAADLQSYSSVLARAVLDRTEEVRSPRTLSNWIDRAGTIVRKVNYGRRPRRYYKENSLLGRCMLRVRYAKMLRGL